MQVALWPDSGCWMHQRLVTANITSRTGISKGGGLCLDESRRSVGCHWWAPAWATLQEDMPLEPKELSPLGLHAMAERPSHGGLAHENLLALSLACLVYLPGL